MATETIADAVLNHTAKPYSFSFSPFLRDTYQVGLSADRPICKAYQTGSCPNGTRCTERHIAASASTSASSGSNNIAAADGAGRPAYNTGGGLNSLVCKHWLRGLCKKGVPCEFLHEYNLRRMPECNFFMRNGYCSNGDECLYLHVDPLSRLPPCPHYDNIGFCPLGPVCARKHVRRRLCPFYLAGFCPDGPACRRGSHPKWSAQLERPTPRQQQPQTQTQTQQTHESDDDDNNKSRADSVAATLLQQQMQGQQGQKMQTNFDDGLKDDRFGGRHGGRGGGGKWRGGGAGPGGGGSGRGRFRGRGGY